MVHQQVSSNRIGCILHLQDSLHVPFYYLHPPFCYLQSVICSLRACVRASWMNVCTLTSSGHLDPGISLADHSASQYSHRDSEGSPSESRGKSGYRDRRSRYRLFVTSHWAVRRNSNNFAISNDFAKRFLEGGENEGFESNHQIQKSKRPDSRNE